MTPTRHHLTALYFISCFLFAGMMMSCSDNERKPAPATAPPPEPPPELRVLGDVPPFDFIDQKRHLVGLSDLKDRVWIANFVFTRCASTCPMQTANLAKLQGDLKNKPYWSALRFLTFTVEPEYDTPEVLAKYAAAHQAERNWHFLTGKREKIWGLCEKGFKLPVDESGLDPKMPILHSPQIVLVDGQGKIRGYYNGLEYASLETLKEDIEKALTETSSITGFNQVVYPNELLSMEGLKNRAEAQLAAADQIDAFHKFRFTDRIQYSGITFRNHVVEDACKNNIAGHYDHGNGIAMADVDGDGLLDIYFTTQIGSNQLWKNLGDGKFEDMTPPALELADRISVTASFADTDNDGDPDLFVTTTRGGNAFFENDGTGKFTDATQTANLAYNGHSSAGVFFDYDRDGLLDLFLCNIGVFTAKEAQGEGGFYRVLEDAFASHLKPKERNETSILYRNVGANRFKDVTEATSLIDVSWTGDASPIDLNNDGWQDLYVTNMQGHDEYYENQQGKTFKKRSREIFPKTPWGSMGIKVFDFNNDGHMDIYLTDMHSDMSETDVRVNEKAKSAMKWPESFLQSGGQSIFGNAVFLNDGTGQLTEVSDQIGAENYWPWGLSIGDLNADGFEDAFITASMNYPFLYGVNSVLLNGHGKRFYDCEFVLGVEPRRDYRTIRPLFTLDPQGADKDHPMVKNGNLTKPTELFGALGSRSSIIADIDNDGDLDVTTNEFNDGPMMLLSNLAESHPIHWIKIALTGTKSNRDALGAKLVVQAGDSTYTRVLDGQSGYLSQSRTPIYLGLGSSTQIDHIEVLWPSGNRQRIPGPLKTNGTLKITEAQP